MNLSHVTRHLSLIVALCATMLCGCQQIPLGSVSEYKRTTAILGVSSSADLYGIKSTDRTLKADSGKFVLSFPGFHHEQHVKDLVLSKPKDEPAAPVVKKP
jgi:hypothetical protein